MFCFVLFCFVLFCFVLFCFVLFCFVLFCFVLFCFVLFCFVLFCFVLFCFVLFCFVLFCFVLFCFVLFCFFIVIYYFCIYIYIYFLFLGTLLEALTTGVKGTDQQRQEYAKLLEDHGKQLSHLLRTKAGILLKEKEEKGKERTKKKTSFDKIDISVIETMMTHRQSSTGEGGGGGLSQTEKEELAALREIIKSKATKTELAQIRKKLDQGAYQLTPPLLPYSPPPLSLYDF